MDLNTTFYHGTYLEDALKIQKSGFTIGRARGRGAILGPGVYMSAQRSWALDYAEDVRDREGRDAGLLYLKINPTKPLDINPNNWPDDFKAAYEAKTHRLPENAMRDQLWPDVGQLAQKMGFDAIVFDKGTTVVYDPSKIRVIKMEPLVATKTATYKYDRR